MEWQGARGRRAGRGGGGKVGVGTGGRWRGQGRGGRRGRAERVRWGRVEGVGRAGYSHGPIRSEIARFNHDRPYPTNRQPDKAACGG